MTEDRYMEVAAVAKRLKKCHETIRRYIKSGKLRAVRVAFGGRGSNWLIPESAVTEILTSSTPRARHQPTSPNISPQT